MRYVFTFWKTNRFVEFGPYETEDEAKEAFQRRFGFWPEDATSKREYKREQ
jgi:hypothetical protein